MERPPDRDPPSDPELVGRCLAGEAGAWSVLVGRYADLVYGLARRAGLKDDRAGDVVQEVGVSLLRNLKRLREQDRLFPWIVKTARREAWKQVRRGRAASRRDEAARRPEEAPGSLPDEALAALEEEQALREALEAVGEACRRLLRALYFEAEGLGYDEVAERLGVPRGSIGPTRGRCLEKMRRVLEARGLQTKDVSPPLRTASKRTRTT